MPAFAETLDDGAINDLVNYLITGQRRRRHGGDEPELPQVPQQRLSTSSSTTRAIPAITPPWGTLNAIDLNKGEIRWTIPFGEYPEARGAGR